MAPRLVLSTDRFEVSKMSKFGLEGFEELIALRDRSPRPALFYWKMSASGGSVEKRKLSRGIPTERHWDCGNFWKRKRRKP